MAYTNPKRAQLVSSTSNVPSAQAPANMLTFLQNQYQSTPLSTGSTILSMSQQFANQVQIYSNSQNTVSISASNSNSVGTGVPYTYSSTGTGLNIRMQDFQALWDSNLNKENILELQKHYDRHAQKIPFEFRALLGFDVLLAWSQIPESHRFHIFSEHVDKFVNLCEIKCPHLFEMAKGFKVSLAFEPAVTMQSMQDLLCFEKQLIMRAQSAWGSESVAQRHRFASDQGPRAQPGNSSGMGQLEAVTRDGRTISVCSSSNKTSASGLQTQLQSGVSKLLPDLVRAPVKGSVAAESALSLVNVASGTSDGTVTEASASTIGMSATLQTQIEQVLENMEMEAKHLCGDALKPLPAQSPEKEELLVTFRNANERIGQITSPSPSAALAGTSLVIAINAVKENLNNHQQNKAEIDSLQAELNHLKQDLQAREVTEAQRKELEAQVQERRAKLPKLEQDMRANLHAIETNIGSSCNCGLASAPAVRKPNVRALVESLIDLARSALDALLKRLEHWRVDLKRLANWFNSETCRSETIHSTELDLQLADIESDAIMLMRNLYTACDLLSKELPVYFQDVLRYSPNIPSNPQSPPEAPKFYLAELLSIMKRLTVSTFVVCNPSHQVLKKDNKYRLGVRLLVAPALRLLGPVSLSLSIVSEEAAQQLVAEPDTGIQTSHQVATIVCQRQTLSSTPDAFQQTATADPAIASDVDFESSLIIFDSIKWSSRQVAQRKGRSREAPSVPEQKCCFIVDSEPFSAFVGGETWRVRAISLPVILTVHVNQEPKARFTLFWDNAFGSGSGALPRTASSASKFSSTCSRSSQMPSASNSIAGRLFEVTSVPWGDLSRALSLWFAGCTGRGFSNEHLKFLARKLGLPGEKNEQKLVDCSKFTNPLGEIEPPQSLWEWLYACKRFITDVHFHRFLWEHGFLLGFASRDESYELLSSCSRPTVILRFSESKAGAITLSGISLTAESPNAETGEGANAASTLGLKWQVNHVHPWTREELDKISLFTRLEQVSLEYIYPIVPFTRVRAIYQEELDNREQKSAVDGSISCSTSLDMSLRGTTSGATNAVLVYQRFTSIPLSNDSTGRRYHKSKSRYIESIMTMQVPAWQQSRMQLSTINSGNSSQVSSNGPSQLFQASSCSEMSNGLYFSGQSADVSPDPSRVIYGSRAFISPISSQSQVQIGNNLALSPNPCLLGSENPFGGQPTSPIASTVAPSDSASQFYDFGGILPPSGPPLTDLKNFARNATFGPKRGSTQGPFYLVEISPGLFQAMNASNPQLSAHGLLGGQSSEKSDQNNTFVAGSISYVDEKFPLGIAPTLPNPMIWEGSSQQSCLGELQSPPSSFISTTLFEQGMATQGPFSMVNPVQSSATHMQVQDFLPNSVSNAVEGEACSRFPSSAGAHSTLSQQSTSLDGFSFQSPPNNHTLFTQHQGPFLVTQPPASSSANMFVIPTQQAFSSANEGVQSLAGVYPVQGNFASNGSTDDDVAQLIRLALDIRQEQNPQSLERPSN